MEDFNKQQGAFNRDVMGIKGEVVVTEAVDVEGVADAYKMRTHKHQQALPNTPPRWEDPSKIICHVSTIVAVYQLLQGDRQPAEVAAKTKRTQTNTKYPTTGKCVIPTDLTSRTAIIQIRVGTKRWMTRRVSHVKMHKHTSMQDML